MRFFRRRLPTNYAEQTYSSPYFVVRYPHQVRYRTAVDALLKAKPATLLDYGAGDGHLLFEAIDRGLVAQRIVAYEPVEEFARRILEKVEKHHLHDQIHVVRHPEELYGNAFEYILCLAVLEHMALPQRQTFYNVCQESLSTDGRVLIDVPVEVGPTLLVKALGRRLLKGREKEYPWRELARIAAGGTVYDPGRFDGSDQRTWIHGHKGFDHRLLRRELAHRFDLTAEKTTPLPFVPAPLGNQEIFFTLKRRVLPSLGSQST
jgi:phospholipid N-methyltransferase